MGKTGDSQGASGQTISKDDLKDEHVRLVASEERLKVKCQEIKAIFQRLDETYAASKESFSVQRYGQLKDMIKSTATDDVIQAIRKVTQESKDAGAGGDKGGAVGLLKRAQEFSSGSEQQNQQEPSAKSWKKSGFFNKLKKMTGFSDEPITDEDVMTVSQLQRDNGRKQRAITCHQMQLEKAATKLAKLQEAYQASKSHAPPKRYQDLKKMIKETVAEKIMI